MATTEIGPQHKVQHARNKLLISPYASLLAGGLAGAVEASITYPFEFAKTRSQLESGPRGVRNPLTLISAVAKKEGIASLYTGCSSLIIGTAFKAGVRFLSYDSIKKSLMDENGRLGPIRGVLAGMFAGCMESVVAVTPTERVKTALIDDANGARRFRGGLHATRAMMAERGINELYRGLLPTTVKQSATSAVRMGSYNVLTDSARQLQLPNNSAVTFGIGAFAGIITVYATQPFDTLKTRTQRSVGIGAFTALRELIHSEGIRGLWKGSTMRLGRLILSGGIVFTIYENAANILKDLV